jgi:S1-C subfamily serine protease
VSKAWIGVAVQPVVSKLARHLGNAARVGFRITRVYPRTLAGESELKVGDIIVALDSERLRPRGMQDAGLFHRRVRRLDIDEVARLTILRAGAEREVAVKLERTKMTPEEARRDRNRDFELTVREVTFFDRDEKRWDETVGGVIVDRIESAGWAQLGGIRPRDLIQRIDDAQIQNLQDYRRALEEITGRKPERVVFVILRGARTRFQYVEPDWSLTTGDEKQADNNKE